MKADPTQPSPPEEASKAIWDTVGKFRLQVFQASRAPNFGAVVSVV